MANRKFGFSGIWLLAIPLVFLVAFYFFPLGKLVALALSQAASTFRTQINWQIISGASGFTFFQASLSTILTILLGLPAAYLFGRFNFSGKNILRIASTLPFILPTVVVAAGFNAMIGPRGWLNLVLMDILNISRPVINIQNTLAAILLAHVFYNTSIVIRIVGTALAQLDRKLEDAALTLGASPWKAFTKITVPLLMPSILSSVLLVFLFDFTSFGVILMMGGPRFTTLEVEIYIQTMQYLNLPLAGILSLIQLGFTMIVTTILMRIGDRGMGVPVMPRLNQESLRKPVKNWEKYFTYFMVLLLLILLTSPLISLLIRSFSVTVPAAAGIAEERIHFSLNYFRELFINRQQSLFYVPPVNAVWNSLRFAGVSACHFPRFGDDAGLWAAFCQAAAMDEPHHYASTWDVRSYPGFGFIYSFFRCVGFAKVDGDSYPTCACTDITSVCFACRSARAAIHPCQSKISRAELRRKTIGCLAFCGNADHLASVDDRSCICFYNFPGRIWRNQLFIAPGYANHANRDLPLS